jgi:single-strand DNA-binding protein
VANFNKVILAGRLTRDPESRTFANGGKVTNIGFAVSNRKKNSTTGQWEDEPMFIDVAFFNRGDFGKLADLVQDKLRKGSNVLIEGKLHLEAWEDKNGGGKRSKHKLVGDSVTFLDARGDGSQRQPAPSARSDDTAEYEPGSEPQGNGGDIPF